MNRFQLFAAGLLDILSEKLHGLAEWISPWPRKFKPCVIYDEGLRLTTMLLADTTVVWCPACPNRPHEVDLGYDAETGVLVGVQIWYNAATSAEHIRLWNLAKEKLASGSRETTRPTSNAGSDM